MIMLKKLDVINLANVDLIQKSPTWAQPHK